MQIGGYRLTAIETGRFALDGGAMFGIVPKALWQRRIPADERNRIPLAARALLIEEIDGPRRILVDTGLGQRWSQKHADVYGIDPNALQLETGLGARGLRTRDITDVVLTHLHFDHAGGAARQRDGRMVPTFENARYWLQERNLKWARQPGERERQSYRAGDFEVLAAEGLLELLDGPASPWPGIELLVSEGHTPAMQMPHVHDGDGRHLVYCADLVPTAAHVPLPWIAAYDNAPLVVAEEKRALLSRAASAGWVVLFEHDPDGAAARVVATDKGFGVGEWVSL